MAGSTVTVLLLLLLVVAVVVVYSTEAVEAEMASTLVATEKPAADMGMEFWEAITDTTERVDGIDMIMAGEVLGVEPGGVLGAPYGRSQGPAPSPHSPQVWVDVPELSVVV